MWHELQKGATMTLKRFGISTEINLLEDPDQHAENRNFPNHSQVVHMLISQSRTEDFWLNT